MHKKFWSERLKGRDHSEDLDVQAPFHEDVLGSGGIAPRILDLDTTWRSLYPQGKRLLYHRIGGSVGPRTGLYMVRKRKIPSPRRESNLGRPAHSPVAN
jgi:hypothetical protein